MAVSAESSSKASSGHAETAAASRQGSESVSPDPDASKSAEATSISEVQQDYSKDLNRSSNEVDGGTDDESLSSYTSSEDETPIRKATVADLFRFATKCDIILNVLGLIAACVAGAAQPLMTLVFGNLTTTFLRYENEISDRTVLEALKTQLAQGMLGSTSASADRATMISAARAELTSTINHDALLLVYVGVAMFVATYIYMATWVYTGEEITRRIREAYLSAVLRQEIAYFDVMGAGEVTTRIQNDIQLIQDGISDKVPMSMMFIATFIAGFVVAYTKSWQLSLAMSSILPCIIGAGAVMNVFITKYQQIELQYVGQAATIAEESLSSVRTAKAFAIEQRLVNLYNESNEETTKQGKKKAVVQGAGLGIFFFVIYASYALAFFFGSKLLAGGHLESGTVMTVIFSIFIGAFSLAMMAPNLSALSYAFSAGGKVFETIDRISQIDPTSTEGLKPDSCRGEIELRAVSFRYPARRDMSILRDFSLHIKANQTTALVGASGSGKSTIVSLIERYYDPTRGQIFLDDVNIKELNLTWLRSQIGFVSQEPILFSTTIRQNIEYGLINTQYEKCRKAEKENLVMEAAKQANAHQFITQLTDGYDTLVGEKGLLLSGGQKQRVAIARAIVGDPKVLLLDEATSALDTNSEGVVQAALDRAAKGRTTLVIAHRLSTIRKADHIVVMARGVIVEQGKHDDLLEHQDGPYYRLVNAQKIRAKEESVDEVDHYRLVDDEKGASSPGETAETPGSEKESIGDGYSAKAVDEKPKPKRRSLFYLLYRLALINKDHIWTLYIPGMIGSVASGAVYPVFSILFGRALQTYSLCQAEGMVPCTDPRRSEMRHGSDLNALHFFIISILATIAIAVQNGNMILASSILMQRLRSLSLVSLLRCDISYFDKDENSSGSLTASLAENSQRINGLTGVTLGTIVQSLSTLFLGWIIALIYSWRLALPMIATAPLTLSAGYSRLKLVVTKDQKIKKAHELAAHRACEAASSIRTVAALTREAECIEVYRQELKGPAKISFRTALYGNILYAIGQALALPTIALGFWYGSHLLLDGSLQGGDFFTVLTATVFASIQAGNAFSFATDISQAHGAAEDSIRLLDNKPEIDPDSKEGVVLQRCTGSVSFENVHFRYPTRPEAPVLRGLSLEAKPGTYVALVGASGCGKSTAIQLLERFYNPQMGRVLIDGHDIRTLNVRSLRRHMALVSQEPILFQGTIGWNIALGVAGVGHFDGEGGGEEEEEEEEDAIEKVTEQQMRKAAKHANILNFIESLPDGFDTQIGGKGTQLSGGQKQRIAIARALIRDPKILLLDEATSALDSESEQIVQGALDKASRGRTTIAIAHRLSTISRADQIYCLQDGIVSEKGHHLALMARKGIYSDLVALQELEKGTGQDGNDSLRSE